jgi:hypothetical protein
MLSKQRSTGGRTRNFTTRLEIEEQVMCVFNSIRFEHGSIAFANNAAFAYYGIWKVINLGVMDTPRISAEAGAGLIARGCMEP